MRDQKHRFAIYYPSLSINGKNQQLLITDLELAHRISKVLRLEVGDELILFNTKQALVGAIVSVDKKNLVLSNLALSDLDILTPKITIALGVLKKENLEASLYSCVELGASEIIPVICAKSVALNLNHDRIQKILISAAEQSKNFNLPVWHEPISFAKFVTQIKPYAQVAYISCDIAGAPMFEIINHVKQQNYKEIMIIIGPEGDFTLGEKTQLAEKQVIPMQLTPTVLRSLQAVVVSLGAFRAALQY